MTGAASLVIPLVAGVVTGHPIGGATVGLGAWLVASRAILDPARVSRTFMLGVVASLGAGTVLGIVISGEGWLIVPTASALAGLGVLVRRIGITPALTLLLTAANPLPLDPLPHTGLQVLGGLFAAMSLTLPWPWRRARPLTVTLSQTAEALADLMEAAADPRLDPGDWDALRRKAGDSLAEARVVYARHRWQRRSRPAEKVAMALRRVFYETVAAHGMFVAFHERASAAVETVGAADLTHSLARSLRSFIGEGLGVEDPLPDYEARVNVLRADRPHGERELLVLVLLRQIGHCADRVRKSLTEAEGAARELHFTRMVLPALTARPKPPPEVRLSFDFDDPRVRHALRALLGTAFAATIIVLFKPPHPHWLVIAVLVTLQPTYGETRARVWARIGGSTVGGLVTVGILHFGPSLWWLSALIGVSAALAFGLASVHQAYWSTFMTMCVLLLIDFQLPGGTGVVESRIVLTVLGGLIAVGCTRLLWPRGETVRLADRVVRMLRGHAAAARTLAAVSRGKSSAERAETRIRQAGLDAEAVALSLDYIAHEPGGTAPYAVEEAVDVAQRVRDDLMSVTSVLRDEPGDPGHVPGVLETVALRLEAAAQAVQTSEPFEFTGDVDCELAVMAASVGRLAERRLAELDADPSDTRTEVRRALVRTAAVDQALRSLGADTVRLCDAATSAFAHVTPEAARAA
ncbi:hypothetical protein GCM10023194_44620 [Planotetraspora phitsanulokensis]|uniref:Integral membrane bound transporter domain-containing protein n=1 Tax=Planotetraspora phitsanulokensis TaxID=575192 RepID=A0A8J3U3R8_9ACTN|nr:FUSC family protein [Planotetraspora phitsanulokensis]GII38063.1 hypothetical protein Pph01_30660 [Planotetraspora phitsanulokensis]